MMTGHRSRRKQHSKMYRAIYSFLTLNAARTRGEHLYCILDRNHKRMHLANIYGDAIHAQILLLPLLYS